MHIILINPPWVVHRKKNVWRNIASVMPPLGLAWLAAVLERAGHRVKILDAHALRMTVADIPGWLRDNAPFDLAGITASTPLIYNALAIARHVKAEFSPATVVLGGVHPTVLPEETLAERAVDLVVRGEGENTLLDIAAGKPPADIDGISYRGPQGVINNPERELIGDLDALPLPAYHLLPMAAYRPAAGAARRLPAASVLATRGCPGRCTFCYRIFGSRLRVRSGERVAQEVKLLQDQYGIREICFYDDTFTAVKKQVFAFCRALAQLHVDLTWSCFARIDTFDEKLFRTMKASGCHQVMYGVETANPDILKQINKRADPTSVPETIRKTQQIGIAVRAAFMLGNPGETVHTMAQTIRYAIDLDPDLAIFNITTPFPGTEMFRWAEKNGYLLTKNWADYDLSTPVMRLPTVSNRTVQACYRRAHRQFYLRPAFLRKRLRQLHSAGDLTASIRGFRAMLGL